MSLDPHGPTWRPSSSLIKPFNECSIDPHGGLLPSSPRRRFLHHLFEVNTGESGAETADEDEHHPDERGTKGTKRDERDEGGGAHI